MDNASSFGQGAQYWKSAKHSLLGLLSAYIVQSTVQLGGLSRLRGSVGVFPRFRLESGIHFFVKYQLSFVSGIDFVTSSPGGVRLFVYGRVVVGGFGIDSSGVASRISAV